MVVGIELYRNTKYDCFKGSEKSKLFTKIINKIFDALNRKRTAEGIKKKVMTEFFYSICNVCLLI